jgi:drug/metabolite transporter (DMT)-like permease
MEGRGAGGSGVLFAVGSAAAAGCTLFLGKLGLEDLSVAAFSFWLFLFATPLTGAWMLAGNGRRWHPVGRRAWGYVALHVALSLFAVGTMWEGVRRIDPTVAGFLGRMETVLVVLLGVLCLRERFRAAEAVGAGVAVAGVALLGDPAGAGGGGSGDVLGFWLVLGSSLGFALTELVSKLALRHMPATVLAFWRNLLLAGVFGAVAAVRGELGIPSLGAAGIAAATAFTGPTLARTLYLFALRTLDLSKTAVLTQSQPLFTAALAIPFLGTVPEPVQWVGGILVILGCAGLVWARPRAQAST